MYCEGWQTNMKKITLFGFTLLLVVINGWAASKDSEFEDAGVGGPTVSSMLFAAGEQHISNEDGSKILFSKIRLVSRTKAAFLQLPNHNMGQRYFGNRYLRAEEYVDFQQKLRQTMRDSFLASDRVSQVVPLPDFFGADQLSLAQMREAGLRLQVHLLVIYTVNSNVFTVSNSSDDEVRAYASCEIAVLDTQSGILPFSNSITAKVQTAKLKSDGGDSATNKRAEEEASVRCLQSLGKSAASYLDSVPL